jgi:hypothetical protein
MPALYPVRIGSEIRSARNPSRASPAMSRITPTRIASSAAREGRSADAASAVAVRIEIVEVTLTLSTRELPSNAYSSIGTSAAYSPTWTGRPASPAYAIACGTTTHAATMPAIRSPPSHARR